MTDVLTHHEFPGASFYCREDVLPRIKTFIDLCVRHPEIIKPFEGIDDRIGEIFAEEGYELYSTVRRTLLVYDGKLDSFLKLIHPVKFKEKILNELSNRSRKIYEISKILVTGGIGVPDILAYGRMIDKLPFYCLRKMRGRSLYDIFIRGGEPVDLEIMKRLMELLARLHEMKLWLGDAHLSHVFLDDGRIEGLIDIDGIRRMIIGSRRKRARDIAGMFHPRLGLSEMDREMLAGHYSRRAGRANDSHFVSLVDYFMERRWHS